MITKEQIKLVSENWLKASEIFGFKIITPFNITINGVNKEIFAFIDGYGSKNGTLISLTSAPNFEVDKEISDWAKENETYCSFINVKPYLDFDIESFKEVLQDWMKY